MLTFSYLSINTSILAQFTGTAPLWHMVPISCIFARFLSPSSLFNLTTLTSLQRNSTSMDSNWGVSSVLFREDLLLLLVFSELEIHRKWSGRSKRQRDKTQKDANIYKMPEWQGRSTPKRYGFSILKGGRHGIETGKIWIFISLNPGSKHDKMLTLVHSALAFIILLFKPVCAFFCL